MIIDKEGIKQEIEFMRDDLARNEVLLTAVKLQVDVLKRRMDGLVYLLNLEFDD